MNARHTVSEGLVRWRRAAFAAGGAGALLLFAGLLLDPAQLFQSYLMAYLFCLAFGLGSLAVLLLHNLTGGAWGFAVRRLLEGALRTLPLLALCFVPIALGRVYLYEWARPEALADPALAHKAPYLNTTFFLARAALYFAVWIGLARAVLRASERADRSGDARVMLRLRRVSAAGLVLYVLTMTGAAFDWAMSLEPHWYSTIYGVQFVVGQGLAALCLGTLCAARLARHPPFTRWLRPRHFHDLGNLIFAFVMLWAYVSFSQFLIIWSGNLPEEVPWYLHRSTGGWQAIAWTLFVLHFALPFGVLLVRRSKRSAEVLSAVALLLIALRLVDLFWLIAPALHRSGLHVSWMDLAAPLFLCGLWLGTFARMLQGRPLLSLQDAGLQQSLEERAVGA